MFILRQYLRQSIQCQRSAVALTRAAPRAGRMAGRPPPPDVLSLGQDVTAVARPGGVDPTQLPVGSLVGVKRSNGSVTVGRVETPLPCTPAGYIHVALGEEDRKRKDVPPNQLYSLAPAPPGDAVPASGSAGENIPKPLGLALGQDVSSIAQPGVDPAQLPIGSLVGVKRSNGSVTVARVTAPAPETPPGQVHVTLEESGAWKDVTTDMLYTIPVLAKVEAESIPPTLQQPPATLQQMPGQTLQTLQQLPGQASSAVVQAAAAPVDAVLAGIREIKNGTQAPTTDANSKDISGGGCFNCLPLRKKNS